MRPGAAAPPGGCHVGARSHPNLERRRGAHLLQVATTLVPFSTDHLFSLVGRTEKQLGCAPCQVVQKPSLLSFQVPWPFAPALPAGSRVTLPSGLNVILNLTLEGVDAVKG